MALFLEHFPQTEEGKKLSDIIAKEILDNCRLVYRKDEESDGYLFKSQWNPNESYGEDDIILPVQSVFKQMIEITQTINFANVIGSTGDKAIGDDGKVRSSWLALLREKYAEWNKTHGTNYKADQCCTDGCFYRGGENDVNDTSKTCNSTSMVGGHVILNTDTPREVPKGWDVYLLPICSSHNISRINTTRCPNPKTGTDYYMKNNAPVLAMRMQNYQPRKMVELHLQSVGIENVKRL